MYYSKFNKQLISLSIIFALFFFSVGCASDSSQAAKEAPKTFFDIKGYFDQEINALKSSAYKLEKKAKIDDKEETKNIEKPDWDNELKILQESDINKTAWIDKYKTEESGTNLIYTTEDETLKTKRIQIDFNKAGSKSFDNVTSILIINNTENVLYNSSEFLTYTPKSSITIIRNQQIKSGENKLIESKSKIYK